MNTTPKLNVSSSHGFSSLRKITPMSRGKKSAGFSKRTNQSGYPSSLLLTPRSGGVGSNGSPFPTQILEETENHTVSVPPNSSSPVLVAEILTMAEKTSDVSVAIGANQWAWLVHGRRLIVWRFGATQSGTATGRPHQRSSPAFSCRELTLPPSDLAHNAKLVNVFSAGTGNASNPTPSCIAVSPEGSIRFWPSIAHESTFSEVNADLQGQECFSLTDIQPVGSILATTTSNVGLVYSTGLNSVACRMLKTPQGLLGGIGRRVSSMFWGSMNNGTEAKLVHLLGQTYQSDSEEKLVFVLSANSLQKWLLILDEPDKLYYNCDLETLAKDAFASNAWLGEKTNPSWLKIWILDMQFTSNGGVAILMGAMNPQVSETIHFGIGIVSSLSEIAPIQFRSFRLLGKTEEHVEGEENLNWRFMMHGSQHVYLFNQTSIICCSAVSDSEESEELDFSHGGNEILGSGLCGKSPYFYFSNQGLVTINPNNQAADISDMSFNDSQAAAAERASSKLCESLNMSVSQAGLDNLTMSESKSDQLKAAFLLFCQRNFNQSVSIIEELFPVEPTSASPSRHQQSKVEVDSSLDKLVLSMSQDLIDDFPASDPRWMESVPGSSGSSSTDQSGSSKSFAAGVGSSMSLLILHQLEDKQRALDFYISFLKEVGLWDRLSGVKVRDTLTFSSLVLCEHMEKTATAISLRQVHSEHQLLVDKAVKRALINRNINFDRGLTSQDYFYREISRVDDIVDGLMAVEDEAFIAERPREIANVVLAVNNVLVTILRDCLETRKRKLSSFGPSTSSKNNDLLEYLPWTSTPGPNGVRTKLINQFKTTNEKAFPLAEDSTVKRAFCTQLVDLADIVLDGYKTQLESLEEGKRKNAVMSMYEKDRQDLIMPLVNRGFHEEAGSLAEKYYEFVALIAICEAKNDKNRLNVYMDRFAEQNFAEFVFAWHVKEGKQGKLLSQTSNKRQAELGRFLKGHSNISWMHDIQVGDYHKAADTLKELGMNESEYVGRKKTMLSLAKLSVLASDLDDGDIAVQRDSIENHLSVISAQDDLPNEVLESYGFDRDTMRVLTPRELIELYIGDDNEASDHIDFKKALDLLNFCGEESDESLQELKLHIFAKSVIKDDWTEMDVDNPLKSIQDSVFFRLAEFCYLQGLNLADTLPEVETLLGAEEILKKFGKNSKNFEYLIRSGYEHMNRVSQEKEEEMET